MSTDYCLYATLGIARNADLPTIRAAYKRLAFDSHPDRNPQDPVAQERFVAIVAAHDVLTDPARRLDYDRFGTAALAQDFDATANNAGPLDLHVQMVLDPGIAQRGGTVRLAVKRKRPCTSCVGREPRSCGRCAGTGKTTGTQLAKCRDCKAGRGVGFGGRRLASRPGRVAPISDVPCATCQGRGVAPVSRAVRCAPCKGAGTLACAMCRGEREATSSVVVSLPFPSGVADGASLRFEGKGHTGAHGEVGDLRVDVRLDRAPAQEAGGFRGVGPTVRSRPVRRTG